LKVSEVTKLIEILVGCHIASGDFVNDIKKLRGWWCVRYFAYSSLGLKNSQPDLIRLNVPFSVNLKSRWSKDCVESFASFFCLLLIPIYVCVVYYVVRKYLSEELGQV
jgi:hypothetical protein